MVEKVEVCTGLVGGRSTIVIGLDVRRIGGMKCWGSMKLYLVYCSSVK